MTAKSFLLRVIVYLLPLVLVGAGIYSIAQPLGELLLPQQVAHLQQGDTPILYRMFNREDTFRYKLASILERQPDVLILGSSRMFAFRSYLFHQQADHFYNGAIELMNPQEIQLIVELMASRDAMPDILIIGLDLPFYNAGTSMIWEQDRIGDYIQLPSYADNLAYLQGGIRRSLSVYLQSPDLHHSFVDLADERPWRIGMFALEQGSGYRNDGSFYWHEPVQFWEALMDDQETYYQQRTGIFEPGDNTREESIDALETVLQLAQTNGTTVMGIFPSFRSVVYQPMIADGEHTYLSHARDDIMALFERYDMPVYDYTDPAIVGGDDNELYDSWHPGERLALRIYLDVLQNEPELLGDYSDASYLEALLVNPDDPFAIDTQVSG